MMPAGRLACFGGVTVAAFVVALATAAYACVPPTVRFSPDSGRPGTEVTVTGSARVEHEIVFHWNGEDGPILARATPADSKVTTRFTVPEAAPGYYLVTAVQPGNFNNTLLARTAFEVTGTGGETPASKRSAARGPGLTEPSSSGSVLPFVVILGGVAVVGIAGVEVLGRRRQPTNLAAEPGE